MTANNHNDHNLQLQWYMQIMNQSEVALMNTNQPSTPAPVRTTQQIFDVVINAGIYNPYLRTNYFKQLVPVSSEGYKRDYYMCHALTRAFCAGIITAEEKDKAYKEIANYLWQVREIAGYAPATMYAAMTICNLDCEPIDLLRLYRDWANRPALTHRY